MSVELDVSGIKAQMVEFKDQLRELASKEQHHAATDLALERKLDSIKQDIEAIRAALVGDPTRQDHPSILMRLDRLEQTEKLRSKLLYLIGSGVIGLILERLRGLI